MKYLGIFEEVFVDMEIKRYYLSILKDEAEKWVTIFRFLTLEDQDNCIVFKRTEDFELAIYPDEGDTDQHVLEEEEIFELTDEEIQGLWIDLGI